MRKLVLLLALAVGVLSCQTAGEDVNPLKTIVDSEGYSPVLDYSELRGRLFIEPVAKNYSGSYDVHTGVYFQSKGGGMRRVFFSAEHHFLSTWEFHPISFVGDSLILQERIHGRIHDVDTVQVYFKQAEYFGDQIKFKGLNGEINYLNKELEEYPDFNYEEFTGHGEN